VAVASIDPKYSIGIPEMDAQHARWIELIEQFRSATSGHLLDPASFDAALRALEQLLDYTKTHFASEEQFIAAHHYPEIEAHKAQHRELVAEVTRLLDEIRLHKTHTTPLKLNLLVTIWLMEHIMTDDDKYARYVRGLGH
jgi:hemerythrin-like metal-binding protein